MSRWYGSRALPTPELEVWRYSRVSALDLDRYHPADLAGSVDTAITAASQDVIDAVAGHAGLVVVHNGAVVRTELDPALAGLGVSLGVAAMPDGLVEPRDAFEAMNMELGGDPVVLSVPAGVVVPAPVLVLHWTDEEGLAVFSRLVVDAGEDSEVVVYDHQASAEVDALVVPMVALRAGRAARLRYANGQVLGHRVWQLGRQASIVGPDATLSTSMVALGGSYARLAVDSTMEGRGGSGEMQAVYFGEADQMHDFRTLQDHVAPATTSNLLFKGAVQGRSRAVYTGLIHIAKQAAGVNAFQTNRNIKLSGEAWAESVPNLEIENNDVRCSHASAVGPVDADQLFYLESRGVPTDVAERLIVIGFFDEVLANMPVAGAARLLRQEVAAKLARREVEV